MKTMIFHLFLFFTSVDPSLGRIDKHSLSQQTLMELLTEDITNREEIWESTENPDDMTDWKKIQLNDANEVFSINWGFMGLQGFIDLKWLPATLFDVYLTKNKLRGTVDFTCLPDGLKVLGLGSNEFHGTIDLTSLPQNMKDLYLNGNDFTGLTDFSQLPQSLKYLSVSKTRLQGKIFAFDGYLIVGNSGVKDMRNKKQQ